MSDAYDMIDRFLRNNLGDDDYAEYSGALDSLCSAQPAQADNLLVKRAEWDALSTDARQLLNAAARAQPAPITSETGNQADQGASAITSVPLRQVLTDPENQPNQYGVEFLMCGPKFAFRVGAQQFTLDYEPTEPGEFEFMRDMLIHAFSTFTPDVKTAHAVPLLSDDELRRMWSRHAPVIGGVLDYGREVEQAVRAKLGAGVPMTDEQTDAMFEEVQRRANQLADEGRYTFGGWFPIAVELIEAHHGIVGKEGA